LHIDINDCHGSVEKIREAINGGYYEKNLDALLEARKLFVNKYHFFPSVAAHIMNDVSSRSHKKFQPESICLKPYRQSATRSIINIFKSQLRKLEF
jgi:hypothetical protein